ncbi:peptidoglycan/LPS O-acetylase OafA/YrhL [Sphingobium xanthum]|uniref:acyltransferase family protein n=1 Tax=Sphingobium xanthum TaxID=1387165 RepID=UPI001C8B94C1
MSLATSAVAQPVSPAPASAARAGRYEALDSLRGLAACWVVIFHLPSDGHSWPLAIVQNGFLAVTFFFVLSGFVIGASYGDRLAQGYSIPKFMFLRWGRIYPLHAFMLGVILIYEIIRLVFGLGAFREGAPFTGLTAPDGLFWNIVLLQEVPAELSWNKPSWSIGVEYWTYLACALLLVFLPTRRLLPAAICLMAPGAVLVVLGGKLGLHPPTEVTSLLKCALGFGIGLAVYEVRRMGWQIPAGKVSTAVMTAIELAALGFMLFTCWAFGGSFSHLIYPAFALLIWVFASQGGHISRLLLTPPMLLLGTLSYSIYMVHQFIQDRLLDLIAAAQGVVPLTVTQSGRIVLAGNPLLCDLVTLVMLALVIAAAGVTYRHVEEPARLWSRRIAEKLFPA